MYSKLEHHSKYFSVNSTYKNVQSIFHLQQLFYVTKCCVNKLENMYNDWRNLQKLYNKKKLKLTV